MKVVTSAQMRDLDNRAQKEFGLDAYELMLEAGRAIFGEIESLYHPGRVCVVCGKGNNAGDGFVVASEFARLGRVVTVICIENNAAFNGAALRAWSAMDKSKVQVLPYERLPQALEKCDVIVDALLGTGISGPARHAYAEAIGKINAATSPVAAVDVPSGLRDEPTPDDPVVKADVTLTVGLPKTALYSPIGLSTSGKVVVLPINFPAALLESDEWTLNLAPWEELMSWLPPRAPDSNKGTYGHVGIIGGALTYAGASVLVARAALRTGCGLATIYSLPAANAIYKTALPEATSVLLDSAAGSYFDNISGKAFADEQKKHEVLAVGPGLGTARETQDFLLQVLAAWQGPLVLDADALNILSRGNLETVSHRADSVATPHPGEMARLTGKSIKDVQKNRELTVRDFAVRFGITTLLKGAGTLVARPDGQVWLIEGAEPALAKGGTGDVLTGVIASLMAQGLTPWKAAVLGAAIHLRAGKKAAEIYGARGVLASEVADQVSRVI